MQRVSRGAVFWGAAFITAGIVVLAIQQGWITDQVLSEAAQWWPLFLIGAGVAIIFAGVLGVIATAAAGVLLGLLVGGLIGGGAANLPSACGVGEPGPVQAWEEGSFSGSGDVEIDLNCVTLAVAGGSGSEWAIEAASETADHLDLSANADGFELQADDPNVIGERLNVGVILPAEEGTNLSSSLNAGDATFDLSDGQWGRIALDGNAVAIDVDLSGAGSEGFTGTMNAGAMSIVVDEDTDVGSLALSANAGAFEVCVPDAVGVSVTVESSVATGHNLDEAGLTEDGGVWRTEGYASAATQLEIRFSGNAASFTLNPDGGCS
jgi:hypothetical protein